MRPMVAPIPLNAAHARERSSRPPPYGRLGAIGVRLPVVLHRAEAASSWTVELCR